MPKSVQIQLRPFSKVLVANRGEVAIRIFRACSELGIGTVAIYSQEDRLHLHRYKADEAYLVGKGKGPIAAYLDIEGIIDIALRYGVDAIHPGYGFLSENPQFAEACQKAGIIFIGPSVDVLKAMGDKVSARAIAEKAQVPTIPGTKEAVETEQDALIFAKEHGYPLIIKAAMGGGGRGMTVVRDRSELVQSLQRSRSEAQNAFGNPSVFLERFLEGPKHIEVQILGDQYGKRVHLFERDCSIQRRHQKVVEIAPSLTLSKQLKDTLYRDALKIAAHVNYSNAGTVEFLVDKSGKHYFIEVNPRLQVEHTVTEVITGRDIVQCQIRIAEGHPLDSDTIRIPSQESIKKSGYCIQLRLTTEDPQNNFAPDTGKITAFRAGEGFGIRLDAGSGFEGAVISPYYDSLLIKVCAWSLHFDLAAKKALRAIQEFRIRGVKTNIPFLENVLRHPIFLAGECDTGFIANNPELMTFVSRKNRANKVLQYIADVTVNGFKGIETNQKPARFNKPMVPEVTRETAPVSPAMQIFRDKGAKGLAQWVMQQKSLLLTDTTFRDAHQSLIATRMRSFDLLNISHATSHYTTPFFSHEMWGGATFDVALRFLHEDPWARLRQLRAAMPGQLMQMLFRSGNAVGYTNYPDNVVEQFIELAAKNGVDVFRIFDCLNWAEGLKPSINAALKTGKICEAAICYTGDITDGKRVKYGLSYYVKLAKELQAAGTHFLGIKDMAGLLKPEAARILVTELKNILEIPVHLHTHDTSGNGVASLLAASAAGVDIVDAALSSMSGATSQPSLNALVAALSGSERDTGVDLLQIQRLADYWEVAREPYAPFEFGLKSGTADVYRHEIPGGQYSNYRAQSLSLGLGERWEEVKETYRLVNAMCGDIVKVTPSSKAVGDMALFMVQNNLSPQDVQERGKDLAFPESFVELMKGMMGQPEGGFPPDLQRAVLKNEEPITCRPGELLEEFHWPTAHRQLENQYHRNFSEEDLMSYAMYPKVFKDFCNMQDLYGDLSVMDTPSFFYGMKVGQEISVTIDQGKTLIVKLLAISDVQKDGTRTLFFELNGRDRTIVVRDLASGIEAKSKEKADPTNENHVGAQMSGKVAEIAVKVGDSVAEGQKLLATEAMKMFNMIVSPRHAKVKRICVAVSDTISAGDLLVELTD